VSSSYEQPPPTGVPKIIHQTAMSDKKKWHPIWEHCQNSWKEKFPNYEYKFWSDEDIDNLIATKYPWFLKTFRGYDKNIKRADAARYFILYEYGGIYADMDYECINNFESVISQTKVSIAESPHFDDGRAGDPETHQNALMISPPKHPFWEKVFKLLDVHKKHYDILYATGPQIICKAIKARPEDVETLPYQMFSPKEDEHFKLIYLNGFKGVPEIKNPNIYSRHHGTSVYSFSSK